MKAKCVCNVHNVVMFSIDTTVIRLNTISTIIMTPKMNNNDRMNLSKTIAMAGLGFLLIAGAFTLSFANSGPPLVNAQQGGNATTVVATPFDTFTANGVITATMQAQGGGGGNQTAGGGNQTAGGGNQTAGGGNQTGGVSDQTAN